MHVYALPAISALVYDLRYNTIQSIHQEGYNMITPVYLHRHNNRHSYVDQSNYHITNTFRALFVYLRQIKLIPYYNSPHVIVTVSMLL